MLNRVAAILLCSAALFGGGVSAQSRPELEVELDRSGDVPDVVVTLRNLFSERFLPAMESGFPLYLEYRVTLRRARSSWFDESVLEHVLEYVVYYDPVRELYVVEEPGVTEQLPTLADLRSKVSKRIIFRGLYPQDSGRYYYAASVVARTLSDSDVDEVFAWLRGENGDSTALERPGFVTRTARRLLVQVAPLPRITLEGRTEDFTHP